MTQNTINKKEAEEFEKWRSDITLEVQKAKFAKEDLEKWKTNVISEIKKAAITEVASQQNALIDELKSVITTSLQKSSATVEILSNAKVSDEKISAITDHYQKTFESVYVTWKERNRDFLLLLLTIGFEILLIFRPKGITELFVGFYNNYVPQKIEVNDFTVVFPLTLTISILLLAILYLMIHIYQQTFYINKIYIYLNGLEKEIQKLLEIDFEDGNFTKPFMREGEFYSKNKEPLQRYTGIIYAMVLLGLLGTLVKGRTCSLPDISNSFGSFNFSNVLDVLLILITFVYFNGYLWATVKQVFNKINPPENKKSNFLGINIWLIVLVILEAVLIFGFSKLTEC